MDSQDRYAQRVEDTAESGRSVGASYAVLIQKEHSHLSPHLGLREHLDPVVRTIRSSVV